MKKIPATRSLCLSLSLLLLLLAGCSKSSKQQILGKWQPEGKTGSQIEFFEDGTFMASGGKPPLTQISGKWVILADGRLKIDATMLGINITSLATVQFSGDEMILTDEKGKAERHKRIK